MIWGGLCVGDIESENKGLRRSQLFRQLEEERSEKEQRLSRPSDRKALGIAQALARSKHKWTSVHTGEVE